MVAIRVICLQIKVKISGPLLLLRNEFPANMRSNIRYSRAISVIISNNQRKVEKFLTKIQRFILKTTYVLDHTVVKIKFIYHNCCTLPKTLEKIRKAFGRNGVIIIFICMKEARAILLKNKSLFPSIAEFEPTKKKNSGCIRMSSAVSLFILDFSKRLPFKIFRQQNIFSSYS